MSEDKVEFTDDGIHLTSDDGEEVTIDSHGITAKDKNTHVKINFTGIDVVEGRERVKISFLGCILGCMGMMILMIALTTAVVVGVVKLLS